MTNTMKLDQNPKNRSGKDHRNYSPVTITDARRALDVVMPDMRLS